MSPNVAPAPSREPTYGDYLKAAFNFRARVPGLGGVPVNWLYLAAVGGISLAAWPLLLVGAAGEVAFLTAMAGSAHFQRAVRAQWHARRGASTEADLVTVVAGLEKEARAKYKAFEDKCDDVLHLAQQLGKIGDTALETYTTYLTQLRMVYIRMLSLLETFARYSADWASTDPAPQIAAITRELQAKDLPEAVRTSRQATLDILQKRAQTRKDVLERAAVLRSEIGRLEQRLTLLRDQALLARDPTVLSQSMDDAAGMLEEHTSWLQENAALFEGLDGRDGER